MRNLKWLKKSTALLLTIALAGSLAACGSKADEAPAAETTQETEAAAEEPVAAEIDKDAFDALLAEGIVADDADIAASEWATAVKEAGVLRVGGTRTSFLFSQLDETDNGIRGFDAGLYQLLSLIHI